MARRVFYRALGLAAGVIGALGGVAHGGMYYVDYGGGGGGTSWADPFGSIQAALDAADAAADTSATIKVGLTTGGNSYTASAKTFAYAAGTTSSVGILGGYDPNTDAVTGISHIAGAGNGLSLMVGGGATATPNVGNFTVSNFDINTSGIGLRTNADTSSANYANFTVSDSVIGTGSTASNPIRLAVTSSGGQMPSLTLDNCAVSTPAGSVMSAVYIVKTTNGTVPGTLLIRNGSTITGAADASGLGKNAAVDASDEKLILQGSTVTNSGAGYGVWAGRPSYGAHDYGHEISNSTITSDGKGVYLTADDFNPTNDATGGTFITNSTITAGGDTGLYIYGWHGTGSDGGQPDVTIDSSTVQANGAAGIAVESYANNGGSMDLVIINGSAVHGAQSAFWLHGGGGNRGNDSMSVAGSTLSAGAADGSTNSAAEVMLIQSYRTMDLTMDSSVVRNGSGGVNISNAGSSNALLTLINSVITDQDGYAVKLDVPSNGIERLTATNATLSDLDGPAVVFGDTTGATIEAILNYVAFVMGDQDETIFENLDPDTVLKLSGDRNAFYEYLAYFLNTGGGGINDLLTNSLDAAAGDAMLAADGIHLLAGSPLIDQYTLLGGDPTVDIDGNLRPTGLAGDIGADEYVPEPATAGLLGLGLAGLAAVRRRRK